MSTALETPANWYPDPSGRAQARYWDGRMWTAHVVRDGTTALDQLDGVQQPREPEGFTRGVNPTEPGPTVGHGTLLLQQLAASRPAPPPAPPPAPSHEPRISLLGSIGVLLGALLIVGAGVLLYRDGVFRIESSPDRVSQPVRLDQETYAVAVPRSWIPRDPGGLDADARYLIGDAEPVSVVIDDFDGETVVTDPSARDAQLGFAAGQVAALLDPDAVPVSGEPVRLGGHHAAVVAFSYPLTDGRPGRIQQYLVEQHGRVVMVLAIGSEDAVERHRDEIQRAAASTTFASA